MLIQPPLPLVATGGTDTDYLKRKATHDCHERYANETKNLRERVVDTRAAGIQAVFDQDVAHANDVFASIDASSGPGAASQCVVEDLLARKLIQLRTGVDPGSPAPANMQIIPSDIPGYLADMAALEAAIASLLAKTYTVAPKAV